MSRIVSFNDIKKEHDELISMEEWDGACWKEMFDTLAQMCPENDPWDNLAAFIKATLIDQLPN